MGIGVTVGILADMLRLRTVGEEEAYDDYLEDFRKINRALAKFGLPAHHEPEDIEVWSRDLFSAYGLHALRRLAAHWDRLGKLPLPCEVGQEVDEVLQAYCDTAEERPGNFDHLIMHSDCDGYYLPADFPNVLYDSEDLEIPYHMLGSSCRLLGECRRMAQELGIPAGLSAGNILRHKPALDARVGSERWETYYAESYVCVSLMEASEQSIRMGAAIWCS